MLAAVAPGTLARLRFPLGELTKPQVRALAADAELPVASKAESQDLCFLAGTGKAAFLARHGDLSERPGDLVDRAGRVLGRHGGHHHFTVGQRRGLGVAAGEPLYVLDQGARVEPRDGRPARGARHPRGRGPRGAAAPRGRGGRRRQAPLPLARGRLPRGRRSRARPHRRLELELADPVDGAAPARPRACCGATSWWFGDDRRVGGGSPRGGGARRAGSIARREARRMTLRPADRVNAIAAPICTHGPIGDLGGVRGERQRGHRHASHRHPRLDATAPRRRRRGCSPQQKAAVVATMADRASAALADVSRRSMRAAPVRAPRERPPVQPAGSPSAVPRQPPATSRAAASNAAA